MVLDLITGRAKLPAGNRRLSRQPAPRARRLIMILFIDDERERIEPYVFAVSLLGLDTSVLDSIAAVMRWLDEHPPQPACIVLDVMLPGDEGLPSSMTSSGLTAGMPVFASLRARFPDVPIVV
jgi:CheY-like chemotaxis protein